MESLSVGNRQSKFLEGKFRVIAKIVVKMMNLRENSMIKSPNKTPLLFVETLSVKAPKKEPIV